MSSVRHNFLLAAVLALAGFSGQALAESGGRTDWSWLTSSLAAAHRANFSGTFVYQHGNRVETSRLIHLVEPGGEYSHLESLDGPHRELVSHGKQTWYLLDDRQAVRMVKQGERRAFPDVLPEHLADLSQRYLIVEAERVRIAGYDTQAVIFQPRDALRYARKVWIHRDSGVVLKAATLNEKNAVVEQYAFTQLELGGNPDRSWLASSNALIQAAGGQAAANWQMLPESAGWVVDQLPAGFARVAELRRQLRDKQPPTLQMVFSDGLAGVSVFVDVARGDEAESNGLSSHGAVNLYRRLLADGSFRITVVGDAPPRTVMQIAESVRYAGQ